MKLKIIGLFLLIQVFFSPLMATKALVVTIDQKHLNIPDNALGMLPLILQNININDLGDLGEVLGFFRTKIANLGKNITKPLVINAWDEARADWVRGKAEGVYSQGQVYIVQGDLTRDDDYMRFIWQEALQNDEVDYVSLVHGGQQWIKDEWGVPKAGGKLRMLYSEGCKGGSGKQEFIEKYHALVAAGHGAGACNDSASPLFSFSFLKEWFAGSPFVEALTLSWITGSAVVETQAGLSLAKLIGNFDSAAAILEGARISYSFNPKVNINNININSPVGESYILSEPAKEDTLNF